MPYSNVLISGPRVRHTLSVGIGSATQPNTKDKPNSVLQELISWVTYSDE